LRCRRCCRQPCLWTNATRRWSTGVRPCHRVAGTGGGRTAPATRVFAECDASQRLIFGDGLFPCTGHSYTTGRNHPTIKSWAISFCSGTRKTSDKSGRSVRDIVDNEWKWLRKLTSAMRNRGRKVPRPGR
jgi:hypothetical protein